MGHPFFLHLVCRDRVLVRKGPDVSINWLEIVDRPFIHRHKNSKFDHNFLGSTNLVAVMCYG